MATFVHVEASVISGAGDAIIARAYDADGVLSLTETLITSDNEDDAPALTQDLADWFAAIIDGRLGWAPASTATFKDWR
jgi:hypothetical protein